MGIPTVNVTREGFKEIVENAFVGLGFPPEAPLALFPERMFVSGSDLTPVEKGINKVIEGLTVWEPKIKEKMKTTPKRIKVGGRDYQNTFTHVNNMYLKKMWGDGLPLVPPTKELVDWILTSTDFDPNTVVAKVLPKGGIATVETLAINLAMAGGRPEYLPVLIAAIEAIVEPVGRHRWWNTTTGDTYPVVIVNGPIARQIRLNSGFGCLGPDPVHKAGGNIGRAIRLILMNVGGAIPGRGTMALYGGAARYTNVVFAEDEEGLPPDWEPLNVERGYPRGTNTVTVHCAGMAGTLHAAETGTREDALETLENWATFLRLPIYSYWSNTFNPNGAPAILLIPRGAAQGLANLGWSKGKIRDFLWEKSKVPESKLVRRWVGFHVRKGTVPKEYEQYPMPISMSPENIMIVVSGGEQSGHAYLMQVSLSGNVVSKDINLPSNWEELLKKGEEDLGPLTTDY